MVNSGIWQIIAVTADVLKVEVRDRVYLAKRVQVHFISRFNLTFTGVQLSTSSLAEAGGSSGTRLRWLVWPSRSATGSRLLRPPVPLKTQRDPNEFAPLKISSICMAPFLQLHPVPCVPCCEEELEKPDSTLLLWVRSVRCLVFLCL